MAIPANPIDITSEDTATLRINDCSIEEKDMIAIKKISSQNPQIKSIDFSGTKVNKDTMKMIVGLITANKEITSLSLFRCEIDDAALSVLSEAISTNINIKSLDLGLIDMTDGMIFTLNSAMQKNKTITNFTAGNYEGNSPIIETAIDDIDKRVEHNRLSEIAKSHEGLSKSLSHIKVSSDIVI